MHHSLQLIGFNQYCHSKNNNNLLFVFPKATDSEKSIVTIFSLTLMGGHKVIFFYSRAPEYDDLHLPIRLLNAQYGHNQLSDVTLLQYWMQGRNLIS